ncbi:ATP-binding protein [Halomonas caseinilytica]|uniref:histidine kinase n=1 Tax=Halomonas caseinilytica TaxID=438744 RepID=A0A1M6V9F7_9GAMM|nr:ATP-binding protein [Halomonas caseinilytica]SEN02020.1 two-component system, OmpR family, sensor histidine kinase KdpD [Halomonas caseinilytica]SHK78120.1 osmosensitive K+ channel signal transduction histidine kinase [Halomonas caseinilytica]
MTRSSNTSLHGPRVLAALSGSSEDAALIRSAHRLAEREQLPWGAVHVDGGRLDADRRLVLEQDASKVARLGGEMHTIQGQDRVAELLHYADEHRITTLLVGCSRPSGWRFWRRSLPERLLHAGGAFDLVMIAETSKRPRFRPRRTWQRFQLREPAIATATSLCALGSAWLLQAWLELADLSLVFLAAVLASAALAGTRAAMLSAFLGFLSFNFFFMQPRFSLAILEKEQLLTVVFFLLVAVVVGQLAGTGRRRLHALRHSQEQSQRLLAYSRSLSAATDREQVCDIGLTALERWLHVPVAFLDFEPGGSHPCIRQAIPQGTVPDAPALTAASWSWQHQRPSGVGTGQLDEDDQGWRMLPLSARGRSIGMVGIKLGQRPAPLSPDHEALLESLVGQLAMALERTRLVGELETTRVSEENERLRSALLSSVSHDLRTPLASIIGSASSLRDLEAQLSPQDKAELLDGILSESERLDRYIQNLLDMTRLGHGNLKLERDWISLDDLVSAAVQRLAPALSPLELRLDWPTDLPLLHVHPALIEQALVNVIDNAARFSPPGGQVCIQGRLDTDHRQLEIRVMDQGPGIAPEMREAVFDMFHTGSEGDRSRYGSGLGLAICQGMVGAHGGSVDARLGPQGIGTMITLHLPLPVTEDTQDSEPPHAD